MTLVSWKIPFPFSIVTPKSHCELSYFTIEISPEVPELIKEKLGDQCELKTPVTEFKIATLSFDICLDVENSSICFHFALGLLVR